MEALSFIACGMVSGLLAGMLGIGGGMIVVPVLYLVLAAHGVGVALIPQVAIATSLAAMVPTAIAASCAQARRGAIDWCLLRRLAPGVAAGAAFGALLAGHVRGSVISLTFVAYASFCAWRMLRRAGMATGSGSLAAGAANSRSASSLAVRLPAGVVAGFIGISSGVAGMGGAFVTVPYLVARSVDMKRAVAASSAVSVLIAVTTTLVNALPASHPGAVAAGFGRGDVVGAIYWPAALLIGGAALMCAPCGVAFSHRLPVLLLRRAFAVFTLAAAAGTLASVLR